jgi:hypothetical protein
VPGAVALSLAIAASGGGVGAASVGLALEVSGGGAGVASAVEVVPGAEESGTGLEGDDPVVFFFFLGAGGTKGSARSAVSGSAPVSLAPVSCVSGGEAKSSSARWSGGVGAARPELGVPPREEAEMLPAPEGAGLA